MKKIPIYLVACLLAALGAHAQGIHFEQAKSLDEVFAKAKAQHKNVFISCCIQGGKPCIEMSDRVYPLKVVGDYYNSHFINIAVDMQELAVDEKTRVQRALADSVKKRYGTNGYPNLLFLDANGKLLHRYIGGATPEGFVALGKDALDPNKQYYTQIAAFQQGKRDTSIMRQLAMDAFNFGNSKMVHEIAAAYLKGKTDAQLANPADIALIGGTLQDKERATALAVIYFEGLSATQKIRPENLRYILLKKDASDSVKYYVDLFLQHTPDSVLLQQGGISILVSESYQDSDTSNGRSYQYLWKHRDQTDSVFAKQHALYRLFATFIMKEIAMPFMKAAGETPDWSALQQQIAAKYSNDYAEHFMLQTKANWYISHKEWASTMKMIVELDKKYGTTRTVYELNNELAKPIINRSTDPAEMQYALGRMQHAIETGSPSSSEVSSYAKLLYNTGNKAEAIRWEKIALDRDPEDKDLSTILEQMNNGTLVTLKP